MDAFYSIGLLLLTAGIIEGVAVGKCESERKLSSCSIYLIVGRKKVI